MTKKDLLPSFSHPLDAIVLAGTHRDSKRSIKGQNKAFLNIDGRPLLRHVVDALLGAQSVAGIFVVGPVEQDVALLVEEEVRVPPARDAARFGRRVRRGEDVNPVVEQRHLDRPLG